MWSYDTFILLFEIFVIMMVISMVIYYYRNEEDGTAEFQGINLTSNEFKKQQRRKIKYRTQKWKHEEKCREILERIYGRKFPSVRPSFLKSPVTGENLELDCYNPDLRLAVEYDGVQHSKYTPAFHKSENDFRYQYAKDTWKSKMCRNLGITLIRVPYFIPYDRIEQYLIDKLHENKLL